jgi:hypothetical protein
VSVLASILKRIVQRLNARERRGSAETVFAAAFGKHPGWDDHIDDIGLDTDVLIAVKHLLYVRGIGGNIDAGTWDKLEREQQAEKFGHTFAWQLSGNIVVGRLWSSCDGKGRTSYPMVVCIQCSRSPLPWMFKNVVPRLEPIEAACTASTSADEVRKIIEDARGRLRRLARPCEPVPNSPAVSSHMLAKLAALPEMGPDRQGLHRILYHIEREVVEVRRGSGSRERLRPTHVRVPAASPASMENSLLWFRFLLARFGADTPVLVLRPVRNPWIDMVIGEPTDAHLFCLRASAGAVPLTSSVPYHMDAEYVARVNRLIEDAQRDTENGSLAAGN